MSIHPGNLAGTPVGALDELEELIRAEYERLHPGDTFENFKRRSVFDKHDKGLMQSWLNLAAARCASKTPG